MVNPGSAPTHPVPSLVPAPSSPVKEPNETARAEAQRPSPIESNETEPSRMPAQAVVVLPRRRPPWMWPAIGAASVFGLIALGVIIITIRGKSGETKITARDDHSFKVETPGVVVEHNPAGESGLIHDSLIHSGDATGRQSRDATHRQAADADHQLDRHEARPDPDRRIPDGLARQ